MKSTDIVTYCQFYIENNWYGKRYRIILSPSEDEGFKTRTEAKKYSARLKKYVQIIFKNILSNKKLSTKHNVDVANFGSLVEYTHNSFGPSLHYKHYYITINDINELIDC